MSLQTRLSALITSIGADIKDLRTKYGDLSNRTAVDGGATPTEAYDQPPTGGAYAPTVHSHDYLLTTGKAVDSDKLDGLDSTAFLLTTGKAADSNLFDGLDSTVFLRTTGKAADSDKLDGLDATAFAHMNRPDLIGWGNIDLHGAAFTSFDAINRFGVSYVVGTVGAPPVTGGIDQWYVQSMSLGSDYTYAQYVHQITFKRGVPGAMATRHREGGVWTSWFINDATAVYAEATIGGVDIAASAFNTVPVATVVDNGGGSWSGGLWTCSRSGLYLAVARVRLMDSAASRSFGVGVSQSNSDGPHFAWRQAGGVSRDTVLYNRVFRINQGETPRLFIYSDGTIGNIANASLAFTRLGG